MFTVDVILFDWDNFPFSHSMVCFNNRSTLHVLESESKRKYTHDPVYDLSSMQGLIWGSTVAVMEYWISEIFLSLIEKKFRIQRTKFTNMVFAKKNKITSKLTEEEVPVNYWWIINELLDINHSLFLTGYFIDISS